MKMRKLGFAAALVIIGAAVLYGQTRQPATTSGYLTPPKVVVDILDAPPTPSVIVSPDHRTVALLNRRSLPTVAELAQPIHRIAGARINPKTNGRQQRGGNVIAIVTEGDVDIARKADAVFHIPATHDLLTPLLTIIPLQLFSYYVALRRGCNVDQPRNLAKSVTVE